MKCIYLWLDIICLTVPKPQWRPLLPPVKPIVGLPLSTLAHSFPSSPSSTSSPCPTPSACSHFRNCCIVRSAHLNALQVQPTVRGQPLGCVPVSLGLPPPAWLTFAEPLLDATLNSRGVNRVTNQPTNQNDRPTNE